ncbi:MAG: hypothetical protein CMJ68_17870 [Planctomycetaceae bacterium]|nr:hypothetical protein [Planctomycetaceae bacterium]|tara:strand:- start:10626 stop:12014 length:1389 start_codon:yes stop_codon:yes gene_type:complete
MTAVPRRDFLFGLGSSLGALALTDLRAEDKRSNGQLPRGKTTHPPRAKAVIMLFMEGGPSQVDTFDPKPKLTQLHLSESTRTRGLATGKRFYVGSPFKSRRVGESGIEMSDRWKFLADPAVADELCVYRGCQASSLNHPEALLHMNTGSRLGSDPGIGSWVNYGLGSENRNLPGYVVMTELALPQAGPANWANGFLPARFQGTRLRSTGSPILDLNPPRYKSRAHQRRALDQLAILNAHHAKRHPEHAELQARMASYELAYRMQMAVPGIVDIDKEPRHLQQAYGLERKETAAFGRQCLMARRLVEQGVRFVQIFSGGWDSHDYLERGHSSRIASVDQPIAALVKDLKARGLLDDTLVVWTGEFGRTPDNNYRGGVTALGRGHNVDAMNMWFAGGGTRPGTVVGATDDLGAEATEVVHPIRDIHVTMLHLLGLDDNKLTYFHGGRFKQLSQFGGELIPEIMA